MHRYLFMLIAALASNFMLHAQSERNVGKDEFHPYHSLGIVLSHATMFEGRDENGHRKTLKLPAWGLDYNYFFHPRWAIGIQADIIVEKFLVEKHDGETIERDYPFAPAAMVTFKPTEHWGLKFGAGAEFESEENFFLNRVGVEYGTHFGNHNWEVFGTLGYDIKWNAYDTWVLGIGISKIFGHNTEE